MWGQKTRFPGQGACFSAAVLRGPRHHDTPSRETDPPIVETMRLLNVQTLQLELFDNPIPRYAILSHTRADDDVQYSDIVGSDGSVLIRRSRKLDGACTQAAADSLPYLWIDAICVDKRSSAELTESINSMYRWYHGAEICYTYLADVTVADGDKEQQIQAKLADCRWFTRGWALQELLAPVDVRFFDCQWRFFGTKTTLCETIEKITHIHQDYLLSIKEVTEASGAQRMSWVAGRMTTKDEDMAYCLLGLFDGAIPIINGEGGSKAFRRLQDEILKSPGMKDDSIFAWGLEDPERPRNAAVPIPGGLFSPSPTVFAGSEVILRPRHSESNLPGLSSGYSNILRHSLLIFSAAENEEYWLLSSGPEVSPERVVGIPLQKSDLPTGGYFRPKNRPCRLFPGSSRATARREEALVEPYERQEPAASSATQYWFWVKPPVGGEYEQSEEVEPSDRRGRNKALIRTGIGRENEAVTPTFVRFNSITQPTDSPACDFILVLQPEYRTAGQGCDSQPVVHCSVLTAERNMSLKEVAEKFSKLEQDVQAQQFASNGHFAKTDTVTRVPPDTKFHVLPSVRSDSTVSGVNATKELAASQTERPTSNTMRKWDSQMQHLAKLEVAIAEHLTLKAEGESQLVTIDDGLPELMELQMKVEARMSRAAEKKRVIRDWEAQMATEKAQLEAECRALRLELFDRLLGRSSLLEEV